MVEFIVNLLVALVLSLFGIGTSEPVPEWCGTEWHFGTAECGACGAELHAWRTVRDYADLEDVPNCAECWECFADDTADHRAREYGEFWNDPERVARYTGNEER